ncbi:MAG: hypothetical protein RLZZ618_3122 [Pseudomonadota bacterium]|jgi:hypothetical protein
MPYQYLTKTFADTPARPNFITAGRVNMLHFVMKVDHRIPWKHLRGALNQVLAGTAEPQVVNALMKLSPSRDGSVLKAFAVAAAECKAGVRPKPHQLVALETIEQEIFSLPANLALGLNNRADDPGGECMDFTIDDVDYAGTPAATPAGDLQKLREKLFGLLGAKTLVPAEIAQVCNSIVTAVGQANLNTATAGNLDHWHPGPPLPGALAVVQRTHPAYRYWLKPTGVAMSSAEIITMLQQVTARALKSK